jgi:hypothetical protein
LILTSTEMITTIYITFLHLSSSFLFDLLLNLKVFQLILLHFCLCKLIIQNSCQLLCYKIYAMIRERLFKVLQQEFYILTSLSTAVQICRIFIISVIDKYQICDVSYDVIEVFEFWYQVFKWRTVNWWWNDCAVEHWLCLVEWLVYNCTTQIRKKHIYLNSFLLLKVLMSFSKAASFW